MNTEGHNMRRVRQGQGMSLKALAEKTEIPYSTLQALESGRRNSGVLLKNKICEALGVRFSEIWTDTVDDVNNIVKSFAELMKASEESMGASKSWFNKAEAYFNKAEEVRRLTKETNQAFREKFRVEVEKKLEAFRKEYVESK